MESACVAIVISFCVSSCCFGLVQPTSYCEEKWKKDPLNIRYVNVCQDDSASLGRGDYDVLFFDAVVAGAPPPQQDIACSCYISFAHPPHQYLEVGLNIAVDGDQKASFAVNGNMYDRDYISVINITTLMDIVYRRTKQDQHPRVCMVIWKYWRDEEAILNVRCEAPVASTTKMGARLEKTITHSMTLNTAAHLMPEKDTTHSMQEKTTTTPMPENSTAHSMPQKITIHSMIEKTETNPMAEKTTTHSMPEENTTHSMQEKTTTTPMPENSTALSMPQKITIHSMIEKTETNSMAENTTTHSMPEENTTHSMQEKTTINSIPEKTITQSMSEKTTINSMLKETTTTKDHTTRSIPEKNRTHPTPDANSTPTLHPSHHVEEEPTNDLPDIVAGTAAGAVIVLAGIVITISLIWRRKYSGNNVDNPVNLHALVSGGQHAKAGNMELQPTHTTIHTDTSETGSIHIYEDMEMYPISPEVSPVSIDEQYVYSESYRPRSDMNEDIVDVYEQVSNGEIAHQYLDLRSAVECDYNDCETTRAQINRETAGLGINHTNHDELEIALKSRTAPDAAVDATHLYSYSFRPAEKTELESAEGSDYEDCTIVTMQHVTTQGVGLQPSHSTTETIDAHRPKLVRSLELSREVPEASIDTQYLYDDTGLPFGDMAGALYTNDDSGNKYEQFSDERTCREHQYIDLESLEGSDYEDCEIVTRQHPVTREHLPPTRATTGNNKSQTNYDELYLTAMSGELLETPIDAHFLYSDTCNSVRDMANADYLNNNENGNAQTSESDIVHQYLELGSNTGSDYADCETIHEN